MRRRAIVSTALGYPGGPLGQEEARICDCVLNINFEVGREKGGGGEGSETKGKGKKLAKSNKST